MPILPVRDHRRHLGEALLVAIVAALLALPGVALAIEPPPEAPPDADANCETMPTSYPSNGEPVPADADCRVVWTPEGVPVAEVWAWGDEGGLHWYNYLAEGYTPGSGSALTMCATRDESFDGVDYVCTTDSVFLLFTMSNMFVTWPSEVDTDLYYCESVDVVGSGGLPATAHACGTLSGSSEGAPVPPTSTPPPSEPPPPATTPPTRIPPTTPTDPGAEDPEDTQAPAAPTTTAPQTSATAPGVASTAGPSTGNPRDLPENAIDPAPDQTPVDSESVALVEGGAFPVALVFGLAVALAIGGVGVLAGPGLIVALRRRF